MVLKNKFLLILITHLVIRVNWSNGMVWLPVISQSACVLAPRHRHWLSPLEHIWTVVENIIQWRCYGLYSHMFKADYER